MKDSETRKCGVCGTLAKVTVDGRLFKHRIIPQGQSAVDAPFCENTSPHAGAKNG